MTVWLSIDAWLITLLSLGYLALLFIVGYWGQKRSSSHWVRKPWVYSLAIGVSCTSWAFYGTVGQAATTGAWLAPIYIGSIACFVFAWPLLVKMLTITKQQNLTTIADFIACRYDRSPKVAVVIAIISMLGMIPYIALQLRAISQSFDLLTGTYQSGINTTFAVTVILIVFSILFGARQLAASQQNQGLVVAIAFSSIVKLLALTAVGLFATFYVFDGFHQVLDYQKNTENLIQPNSIYLAVAHALLGAVTIFILPQQYHMMMIENHHQTELHTARWMYPLYLLLINLFVLPIALAGQYTFPGGSVNADTYVLTLPLFFQQSWLSVFAFIGGLAAATSMVIVAAIVLSTMLSTEIINPLMLRLQWAKTKSHTDLPKRLLNSRRFSIGIILLMAFGFERIISKQDHLASIGLLSFVLLAQFAPAVIGALYWRKATTKAVLAGLIVGTLVWLYTLLLPSVLQDVQWVQQWVANGPFGVRLLKPDALFGLSFLDSISHGVFYSLLSNVGCYVVISIMSQRSVGEKLQAGIFVSKAQSKLERRLSLNDLDNLLRRFIDPSAAQRLRMLAKPQYGAKASLDELIEYTRLELSGVLGSASTRMVMKAASSQQEMPLEDVVSIVDEANQLFKFNRELLQAGVENIEQGISVVDADMRLVAWNKRYIELMGYPDNFVIAGRPVEELLRFNVERGVIEGDDIDKMVARRVSHMRAGNSHHFQRIMPSGIVIEIRGQAMPGGGFVSTFSDITAFIAAEKALKKANESLEKRVEMRTAELTKAIAEAEAANSSKTRFLAAASHDLMQPFNALSLFTSMLKKKVEHSDLQGLAQNIDDSLNVVEALLSDLVEISRLDSSTQKLNVSHFPVNELLEPLKNEFLVLAEQANIDFRFQPCSGFIASDKNMLRRIIQNFLSNAVHYCPHENLNDRPKIVLGVRHTSKHLVIQVWDNGQGISKTKQEIIFHEFERLEQTREIPGLGLGLAISERIAKVLGHKITLSSAPNKGTCFSVTVPRTYRRDSKIEVIEKEPTHSVDEAIKSRVLVIDNDPLMLTALATQLSEWGCEVATAKDRRAVEQQLNNSPVYPRLIIADYHLEDGVNGVDLVQSLLTQLNTSIPSIICSADPSERVRQHTADAKFYFMRKPVKALALKRLLKQLLA